MTGMEDFWEQDFPGISFLTAGYWTSPAVSVVILLKSPPDGDAGVCPEPATLQAILTPKRLNIWFSKRCAIKGQRTSEDIDMLWSWILNKYPGWADLYHRNPFKAEQLFQRLEYEIRGDLSASLKLVPSSRWINIFFEYRFGARQGVEKWLQLYCLIADAAILPQAMDLIQTWVDFDLVPWEDLTQADNDYCISQHLYDNHQTIKAYEQWEERVQRSWEAIGYRMNSVIR